MGVFFYGPGWTYFTSLVRFVARLFVFWRYLLRRRGPRIFGIVVGFGGLVLFTITGGVGVLQVFKVTMVGFFVGL